MEFQEKKEQDIELPKIMFHGTSKKLLSERLGVDGSYKNSNGSALWLSRDAEIPRHFARSHANKSESNQILIAVRTNDLILTKPPYLEIEKAEVLKDPKHGYRTTEAFPIGSFFIYDLTADPEGVFSGKNPKGIRFFYEKLGEEFRLPYPFVSS